MSASVVNSIVHVFIPFNSSQDNIFSCLSSNGEYSIKSGVALIQGLDLNPNSCHSFGWIWKSKIPPKIQKKIMENLL